MANELAHPGAPGGGPNRDDDALSRAIFALNNQRPHDAERIAGEVLKADPRHARALHIFGHALLLQGRADDAIAALEPAARSLHDPAIDTQLAIALRQAGRIEDALARLKRAAKRRPPYPPAFNELGGLLFFMKRYDEAVEALGRGIEVAPALPELSMQLGHVFLALRNSARAKAAFARALEIAPGSASALWGMGKAHQQLGENQAAVEYFRRCLILTPNDAGTWLNLGHCLVETGDLNAGYDCFRKAARGDQKLYYGALTTLVRSSRGRFWLKPSAAVKFLREEKS
jgi:tetratricopeptide (TPR) repeat protein